MIREDLNTRGLFAIYFKEYLNYETRNTLCIQFTFIHVYCGHYNGSTDCACIFTELTILLNRYSKWKKKSVQFLTINIIIRCCWIHSYSHVLFPGIESLWKRICKADANYKIRSRRGTILINRIENWIPEFLEYI